MILCHCHLLLSASGTDSTKLDKFISNNHVSFNFNYHYSLNPKENVNSFNPEQEFSYYLSRNLGPTSSGAYDPNYLCYAFDGGYKIMSGILFKYRLFEKRNWNIKLIYGLNFSFENNREKTTLKARKQLDSIRNVYAQNSGYPSSTYSTWDTTSVLKNRYEIGVTLPLWINVELSKYIDFETGMFFLLNAKVKYKYTDSNNNYSYDYRKIVSGTAINIFAALNFKLLKKMEFQIGYDYFSYLFTSFRFNLN